MLDLSQTKLSKAEWEGVEKRYEEQEMMVINLISKCGEGLARQIPRLPSLGQALNIAGFHNATFDRYLKKQWESIARAAKKLFDFEMTVPTVQEGKMKKSDRIKFGNLRLAASEDTLLEPVSLAILRAALRAKKRNEERWLVSYYTFRYLRRTAFAGANRVLCQLVDALLLTIDRCVEPRNAVVQAVDLLENNHLLHKYAPIALYPHQRELVRAANETSGVAKLILYTAPTGTGKTLTPLGLVGTKAVVYMCAARHVGLALARAAVSAEIAVAFAFGCANEEDVRLHYSAATKYTRDHRTGGIRKVDNTSGKKVQLIVCDMQSYPVAMRYMMKYREAEEIVWYWDEPTMTLDLADHPCHKLIFNNWEANLIPTVVLCSATLPSRDELDPVFQRFELRFQTASLETVAAHDFRKTITLLNKAGEAQTPHSSFSSVEEIKAAAALCLSDPTTLRYVDLHEVVAFIKLAWDRNVCPTPTPFHTLDDVTMEKIKTYYLQVIGSMSDQSLAAITRTLSEQRTPVYESTVFASSSDAHTLTDGPTIFMCDDTAKVGRFLIQQAGVPSAEMKRVGTAIARNEALKAKMKVLEHKLEDLTAKDEAAGRVNKLNDVGRGGEELNTLRKQLDGLRGAISAVALDPKFVPNKPMHLRRYGIDADISSAYCSKLSEDDVMRIMQIDGIEISSKLLVMLGIGVFEKSMPIAYLEMIKDFAVQQKLYLIVASADYTYGTNYQFCHGYVGSGLTKGMSREKIVQAFGRVGRGQCQQTYSLRVRDDSIVRRLFTKEECCPELANLLRLMG